jgi:valacyclovir hydrolase
MAWFEHDGSRICYKDAGSGDAILLMPGWSESIEEFADIRPVLTNFRVIAADLPGSGKSGPQPRAYPATFYHDDARSFLALLNQLGASPAHVVGFSDGGEVGLVMAEQQPGALRSLFAWGAAGRAALSPEMLDAFSEVVDAPAEGWAEFSQYLKDAYGEANARSMARSFAAAWREIIAAGGDVSCANASQITCPTLLIAGEHDPIAPPAAVAELAGAIPGGQFLEAKGCGHTVHRDQPEWFVQTLAGWLKDAR